MNNCNCSIASDVQAVITSFNQGSMIREAVDSLCSQTTLPAAIIIVDDGSEDETSIRILQEIQADVRIPVPVTVQYQPNGGVSSARNTGIRMAKAPMVLILDGDDRLEPEYIEQVSSMLRDDQSMVAASSWMHTFGVLDAVVQPCGGSIASFLARNCCPATHILRREAWKQCGGYDESMRSGFEDWDFFLSMLETIADAQIGIVEKPLIDYRMAPVSANVKSMSKRLELMQYIVKKHISTYQDHVVDAVLGLESISIARLFGWESEILSTIDAKQNLSKASADFLEHPTYGDGGMASAVRIASFRI